MSTQKGQGLSRRASRREVAKVALAMLLFFLILFGCFLGTTASLSLFLNRVGVALFPAVYVANAAFMIAMAFVYSLFADRVNNFRIAGIFFAADIVVLLSIRLLLGVSDYYAPMLLYILMTTITNYVSIQFWAICDNVFSFMDSKRLYSMIGAGGTVGIAAAGFATKYLAGIFHTENLIVICAVMLGLSLFIVYALRPYAEIPPYIDGGKRDAARVFRDMFEGCRYVMGSRMFLVLSAVTGIGFILSFCIDYFYSDLVLASIATEDGVTAFLGLWSGILNTATLVLQFFCASAIITKAGVGNTSVMTPASCVAGYGLLAASYSLPCGIFAKVVPAAARHALGIPAANIMCYLADEKSRVKVRTFISIFVMSLAMLVSGMLLKMATAKGSGSAGSGMCVALLALSAVMLGLSLFLRACYRRNIFDFLRSQEKVSIFDYLNQFARTDKDLNDALVSRLSGASDDDALIVLDILLKTGFHDRRAAYARLYGTFTPAVRAKFASVAGCLGDHDLLKDIAGGYDSEEESVRITILKEFDLYNLPLHRDILLRERESGSALIRILAGKLLFKKGVAAGQEMLQEYVDRASCDESGILFIREWNNLHIPLLDDAIARCLAAHGEDARGMILRQLRVPLSDRMVSCVGGLIAEGPRLEKETAALAARALDVRFVGPLLARFGSAPEREQRLIIKVLKKYDRLPAAAVAEKLVSDKGANSRYLLGGLLENTAPCGAAEAALLIPVAEEKMCECLQLHMLRGGLAERLSRDAAELVSWMASERIREGITTALHICAYVKRDRELHLIPRSLFSGNKKSLEHALESLFILKEDPIVADIIPFVYAPYAGRLDKLAETKCGTGRKDVWDEVRRFLCVDDELLRAVLLYVLRDIPQREKFALLIAELRGSPHLVDREIALAM